MGIALCLLVGLVTFGSAAVTKAEVTGQGEVVISYTATGTGAVPPTGTTIVDKGTPHPAAVQTGDQYRAGQYSLLLAGAVAVMLLVLLAKEYKEREDNRF